MRVLIVDDQPRLLRSLELRLVEGGFAAVLAASIAEAEERLSKAAFDAMAVDMQIQEGDPALLLLTARDRLPHMLLVAMTGDASLAPQIEAAEGGHALQVLTKPFEPEALIKLVRDAYPEWEPPALTEEENESFPETWLTREVA